MLSKRLSSVSVQFWQLLKPPESPIIFILVQTLDQRPRASIRVPAANKRAAARGSETAGAWWHY